METCVTIALISCFGQDTPLSNVNTVNTSETSKIHAERAKVFLSAFMAARGFRFHLHLDFFCPKTAATTDMMWWETGHIKIFLIKN